jgi:hypothetical protein
MQDIFLSLYAVSDGIQNGLLAFLVLGEDEDDAVSISDEFVDHVNTISAAKNDFYAAAIAQEGINALRKKVCFLREADEVRMLSEVLAKSNPHLGDVLSMHEGGVFTVRVTPEEGFPARTTDILRKRMVKHHVVASLSVPIA